MRLHVVFDKDGSILGAARLDSTGPLRVRPVADEGAGQQAAEVHVPPEYEHYDLAAVCQRLKVSVKDRFPELTTKK
jgi:hypothetical protein